MQISPAVLEPVATVTVVDVVLRIGDVRTKTDPMFADVPHSAVWMSPYAPEPLLSEHVGDAFVLPLVAAKMTRTSPLTGVMAAVRSDVDDVPPPTALVR